jgi:FtsH-binding integral membrane protein
LTIIREACQSYQRSSQRFVQSAFVLLALTAIVKVISALGTARILDQPEPLFQMMTHRQMMFMAAGLEVFVIWMMWRERSPVGRAALVAWLGMVFLIYQAGLWWVAYDGPCPCLGNITAALGIPAATAGLLTKGMLVYLLAGSAFVLICARGSNATGNGTEGARAGEFAQKNTS